MLSLVNDAQHRKQPFKKITFSNHSHTPYVAEPIGLYVFIRFASPIKIEHINLLYKGIRA